MESGASAGLSTAAVVAIVCNLLVAVLILILFVVLYKACKVPSSQERAPVLAAAPDQQKSAHKAGAFIRCRRGDRGFTESACTLGTVGVMTSKDQEVPRRSEYE
ncbi:hypothetical protein AAFF_G00072730 [Aldrovandia affinis]|uniref:Uncharacterized protein n=1 Tax=Aldrovandia affinis TaxID=143900 RepID=A0AAD7WEA7_9TELE|nr:hypothetical protein AAFF_G00072730 [Aldrovandia affinis]